MLSHLRHWSHQLAVHLPSMLPSSCALCGMTGDKTLCDGCEAQFFKRTAVRCVRCAIPLPPSGPSPIRHCGECLKKAPAFDATVVAADYTAPIDQMVLALKFGSRLALAPLFARLLRDAVLHAQTDPVTLPSVLTAVPLGADRLAERGFNQSLEMAKPLARALGVRLDPTLALRTRNTQAQARLHPDERKKNIRHAFIVSPHAIDGLRGQHVGVVDDVMTTGETLNELAATLKRYGAVRVTNLVFARTLQK